MKGRWVGTSLVQSGRSYQPLLARPVNPFGLRPRSRRGARARPWRDVRVIADRIDIVDNRDAVERLLEVG